MLFDLPRRLVSFPKAFHTKSSGFTLVELLVVISIVAVLSVIGMVVFTGIQNRARNAKMQADFDSLYKNLEQARVLQQRVFRDITGSSCTECNCRGDNVTTDTSCINTVTNNWSRVTSAPLPQDPWGGIYMFDENEGEFSTCTRDIFYSAGPDNIRQTSDDIAWTVPPLNC